MKIIIRDDDANFFTKPRYIEMGYLNCFKHGIRISIGVTPLQEGFGGEVRTDIPKNLRSGQYFNVLKNKELCGYLRKLSGKGSEICLHGIFHNNKDARLSKEFIEKFDNSIEILEKISGKPVKTYIPPFNMVSRDILEFIRRKNMNISYKVNDNFHYLKLLYWNKFFLNWPHLNDGRKIFLVKNYIFGYRLSLKKNPKKCFEHALKEFDFYYRRNKPWVLANHYWDFFKGENGISPMIDYWNKFIDIIREKKGVEFVTFSDYNQK